MKYVAALLLVCSATLAAQATKGKADLKNAKGQSVGTVTFSESSRGVTLHAKLMGLPPGTHGFHIHTVGMCEPPFTTAGGHFNPTSKQHGRDNPMGAHAGDLSNIVVGADGKYTGDVLAAGVTLAAGANSLFKDGGTAVVIHADADDYKTDPTGNAGARIACGVITK